jgi:hypothetical protein
MKVRIKELAQEAKFIRLEETRVKVRKVFIKGKFGISSPTYGELCSDFWKLNSHRKCEVREAARAAQLAYAFLRGIPYSKIENKRKPEKEYRFKYYILPEVKRLVFKFGNLYKFPPGFKSPSESYDEEVEKWINQLDIN